MYRLCNAKNKRLILLSVREEMYKVYVLGIVFSVRSPQEKTLEQQTLEYKQTKLDQNDVIFITHLQLGRVARSLVSANPG